MSSYTKVNPEELKTLASTIQKAKNNIDTCLTEYKNNLNKINEEGYLQGVANATISTAYSKLVALVEEFGNYGETVRTKLNEIATETEKIDESEGKKAEDVYSQDPLTFGVAAANAILGASASEQAAQVNEETTQISSESTPYANVAYDEKRGYVITKTPLMANSDLYKVSGHWDHYKDGMFVLGDEEKDDEVLALRPMTCPFQYTIYNAEQHSYRDLPIRYAETSTLFRKEASGEMHGLIRVRQFTLADGHIVCTPEQLEEEFKGVVSLIDYIMNTLGIAGDISYRFSKWDPNNTEKYINNPEAWESTQDIMRNILNHLNINYVEADDEAAFYGPKLDIQFKNVHGKEDTIITVQIDFALAERFNMTYVDKDGEKKRPYIIHRSSIGCYERTLAMLIEKYAGALPTWLCPVQAKILPISDKYNDYADKVANELRNRGLKVETDYRAEKIGYKIREARLERTPYILVVGEKEAENNEVSVRSRKNGEEGAIALDTLVNRIANEVYNKEI